MVQSTALFSLIAGTVLSFVSAAPTIPPVVPGAFIVEFADGQDEASFYNELGSSSIAATPRLSLSYSLFKGASFRLDNTTTNHEETAARIASSPVVKQLWPVRIFSVPKDEVLWTAADLPDPESVGASKRQSGDTFSPHVMTQVDKLHAAGVTGIGLRVAIIDTGIDYLHPALGGGFGPGFLVSYGTDLVGDSYDGSNAPVPDNDPIDECEGHGTHVAGIVAAQENPFGFTGTAPGVTLGAYRVFGCGGSAGNDVLIAAYNQAFEDGSDIITASIGGPSGWSEEPWAVAVQRIVEAGVPCTVSAGNDGDQGQFYASTAANGKGVTAVASIDNTEAPNVLVNATWSSTDGDDAFGFTPGSPADFGNISLPLWSPNTDPTDAANGCDPYPDSTPNLSGNIVLIRRGTCTFVQKATNAAAKGARYILLYNNAAGTTSVTAEVDGIEGIGMVLAAQGVEWVNLLAAGTEVIATITDPKYATRFVTSSPNDLTGGFASTFTSWGPTYELDVKPQVAAPGGIILSTYPRALGAYAVLSGTSMACPQAAAVVALIAEVRGSKDPRMIENLLAATANPNLFHNGVNASSFLAPVPQTGAGLIQAYDAAYSTTLLSVSSLSFNDTDNLLETTNFTVKNTGYEEVTYQLGNVISATTYTLVAGSPQPDTFTNEFVTIGAGIDFGYGGDKITVAPGEEKVVQVEVSLPEGLDVVRLPVYSGYITLNGTNGEALSLPYLGVAGSMYDATVLDGGSIFLSNDESQTPIGGNTTFTIPRNSTGTGPYPVISLNQVLGSRKVLVDVVPASSGYHNTTDNLGVESLGQVYGFPEIYVPRGLSQFLWDGSLADESYVPAGRYTIVLRALHIFGNPDEADDYDSWESPIFSIKYT